MSAQCRHGLIRYECWQCRDESKQSTHVAQVFAGGLVTAVQQLEERDAELSRLRQDLAAARAERDHFKGCISAREVRALVDERDALAALLKEARTTLHAIAVFDPTLMSTAICKMAAIDSLTRIDATLAAGDKT